MSARPTVEPRVSYEVEERDETEPETHWSCNAWLPTLREARAEMREERKVWPHSVFRIVRVTREVVR